MRKVVATMFGIMLALSAFGRYFRPKSVTSVTAQETVVVNRRRLVNPLLISILLVLGVLALLAEMSAPGGFVAGLVGVIGDRHGAVWTITNLCQLVGIGPDRPCLLFCLCWNSRRRHWEPPASSAQSSCLPGYSSCSTPALVNISRSCR